MRTLVALVVVAVLAAPAPAREPQKAKDEERVRVALEMVGDALGTVESLEVPGNRRGVQVSAAIAAWAHDRALARRALSDAGSTIATAFEDLGPKPGEQAGMLISARQALLTQFAEKDPGAALDFLLATRAAIPPDLLVGVRQQETQIEMQIAQRLAATEPERAAELVERAADGGLNYGVVAALVALREKDAARASAVARRLVEAAIRSPIFEEGPALYTILELLRIELAARSGGDQSSTAARPLLDDRAFRALLDAIVAGARALAESPYGDSQRYMISNVVASLGEGMGALERFAPSHAQALRKLAEAPRSDRIRGGVAVENPLNDLQQAPIDDLLKRAEGAPAGMRNAIYYQAATRLAAEGDLQRAKAVVAEGITDPAQRASLLDSLERFATSRAIGEGRYAEALAAVEKLDSVSERVQMLVQISQTARAQQDFKVEAQALERAQTILGERPRDAGEFYAALVLAGAFADSDPARGLAIVELCVDRINKLADASAMLEGFGCGDTFDRGELRMWEGGPVSGLATQAIATLGRFASADLAAARAAAGRFERPEIRALAQLAVATAALDAAIHEDEPDAEG